MTEEEKTAQEELLAAVKQHHDDNDARLKKLEETGVNDALAEEKVAKLNTRIDELEATLKAAKTAGKSESKDADATEEKKAFWQFARKGDVSADERKALTVADDTAAGFLAPMEYVHEIIKGIIEYSPVRSLARIRTTSNKAIQIPKRTGVFSAQWVAEVGTRSETTGLTYGLEEIPAHELYALIDISNQELEDSVFNLEAEIKAEAAEQFGVAEGTALVSGNGVGKPQGLTNGGLSTTNSGAAATIADASGQANGWIELFYALNSVYANSGTWLLNRTTLGAVRKLKDAENNYIWLPGIAGSAPATILGRPYVEATDMPTEGAGNVVAIFGDFRRAYTIVDRVSVSMLRDPYTQATSGKVRFIVRKRVGGQVVLAEALRTLTCAA